MERQERPQPRGGRHRSVAVTRNWPNDVARLSDRNNHAPARRVAFHVRRVPLRETARGHGQCRSSLRAFSYSMRISRDLCRLLVYRSSPSQSSEAESTLHESNPILRTSSNQCVATSRSEADENCAAIVQRREVRSTREGGPRTVGSDWGRVYVHMPVEEPDRSLTPSLAAASSTAVEASPSALRPVSSRFPFARRGGKQFDERTGPSGTVISQDLRFPCHG